jgi:hypothetical protein
MWHPFSSLSDYRIKSQVGANMNEFNKGGKQLHSREGIQSHHRLWLLARYHVLEWHGVHPDVDQSHGTTREPWELIIERAVWNDVLTNKLLFKAHTMTNLCILSMTSWGMGRRLYLDTISWWPFNLVVCSTIMVRSCSHSISSGSSATRIKIDGSHSSRSAVADLTWSLARLEMW